MRRRTAVTVTALPNGIPAPPGGAPPKAGIRRFPKEAIWRLKLPEKTESDREVSHEHTQDAQTLGGAKKLRTDHSDHRDGDGSDVRGFHWGSLDWPDLSDAEPLSDVEEIAIGMRRAGHPMVGRDGESGYRAGGERPGGWRTAANKHRGSRNAWRRADPAYGRGRARGAAEPAQKRGGQEGRQGRQPERGSRFQTRAGPARRPTPFNALASVYACCGTTTIHKLCVSPVEELRGPPFHVKRDHGHAAVHRSIHSRRKRSTSRFT
jgi:hypothetical protein